jgi:glutamyl-tRNA reductase
MVAATGPSRLLLVGANHRTSTVALRDRLMVEEDQVPVLLGRLREHGLDQAVFLATCDRVEVGVVHDDPDVAAKSILDFYASYSGADSSEIERQCYRLEGRPAVQHLFGVAASLESLVVGEPQILGQLKTSHRLAQEKSMVGPELDGLLAAAYHTAKRVRTETSIGERPVSIAAAAERLACNVHGGLDDCAALLIGAGEMGEWIAEHLRRAGLGRVVVIANILAQAEELALRLNGHFEPFDNIVERLPESDIVISAVASGRYVLTQAMVKQALATRRQKPMFLIDAGVPVDVEPAVNDLDSAFVYDLGDLEGVAVEGLVGRDAETTAASEIIDQEVERYFEVQAGREVSPLVAALRDSFEKTRREVLDNASNDTASATRLLVNRLLHGPSEVLRTMATVRDPALPEAERLIARLFGIKAGQSEDSEDDDNQGEHR